MECIKLRLRKTKQLTVDSRSPGLELDPGTPEYEGPFTQLRVRLTVVPNDN
jgi:hypothetical protein